MALHLLAFILFTDHQSEQTYDSLGRSQAQILKMGRDKWRKVYEKEAGLSNQDMIHAEGSWYEAEAAENDRLAKGRGTAQTAFVTSLRADLFTYQSHVVETMRALGGGGTMWFLISAGLTGDSEDAIYAVLTHKRSPHRRIVSEVTKKLNALEVRLSKDRGDLMPPFGTYDNYAGELKEGRAAFLRAAKRCASLPRAGSDWILDYCLKVASTDI